MKVGQRVKSTDYTVHVHWSKRLEIGELFLLQPNLNRMVLCPFKGKDLHHLDLIAGQDAKLISIGEFLCQRSCWDIIG